MAKFPFRQLVTFSTLVLVTCDKHQNTGACDTLLAVCTRGHTLSQPGQLNPRRRVDVEYETGQPVERSTVGKGHRVRVWSAQKKRSNSDGEMRLVYIRRALPSTDVHVIYPTCCKHDFHVNRWFLGQGQCEAIALLTYAQLLFKSWSCMDKNCWSTLQHTSTQNHDVYRPSPCINPCIY